MREQLASLDAKGDGDLANTNNVSYGYDHQGLRVSKQIVGGLNVFFLRDPKTYTGYSQVLQQSATAGGSPNCSYIIGQDVIGQSSGIFDYYYDGLWRSPISATQHLPCCTAAYSGTRS